MYIHNSINYILYYIDVNEVGVGYENNDLNITPNISNPFSLTSAISGISGRESPNSASITSPTGRRGSDFSFYTAEHEEGSQPSRSQHGSIGMEEDFNIPDSNGNLLRMDSDNYTRDSSYNSLDSSLISGQSNSNLLRTRDSSVNSTTIINEEVRMSSTMNFNMFPADDGGYIPGGVCVFFI